MSDPVTGGSTAAGLRLVLATGHQLSLALLDGGELLAERHEELRRGHAEALLPALRELLRGGPQPSAILVETGPGSFTGLRVGVAAARALGLAWGCPVHGISSMALVAAGAALRGHRGPLLVLLLAPRGQIWAQAFDGLEPVGPPEALPAAVARERAQAVGLAVTGSGARALGLEAMEDCPRASWARIFRTSDLSSPLPVYVRPADERVAA